MSMKTPKIALLVDTATGWGRRITRGFLDYSVACGPWNVWVEPKGQNEQFSLPDWTDLDGVVARVSSSEMARELKNRNIPVVNISGLVLEDADFPRVTADWEAAAKLAEEHFRDRALSNFAYVGPLHLAHVLQHERAFEQALASSGNQCHVFHPEAEPGSEPYWHPSKEQLGLWLVSLPKPIGIYSWAFQVGRDIISACHDANIPVPYDVAVLGGDYDDLLSDASHPALSGVVIPAKKIGYQAALILDKMMQGGKPPRKASFIAPEEIEERLSSETLAIDDPQILQALAFLRAHACEGIQIKDVLKEVPMARRALERRFVKLLGRSPAQEMRRIRINQARKLLAKTSLDMQEIAEACGYASYNYLGNVFKKETGISPGRYRNQARSPNSE